MSRKRRDLTEWLKDVGILNPLTAGRKEECLCPSCKHKRHHVKCPYLADYRQKCCFYTPIKNKNRKK